MIVIYVDDLNIIGTKKNTKGIKLFERIIYVERSLIDKVLSSPKNWEFSKIYICAPVHIYQKSFETL